MSPALTVTSGQHRFLQFRARRQSDIHRLGWIGQRRVRQVSERARRRDRIGQRVSAQTIENRDPPVLFGFQGPALLPQSVPLQLRPQQVGLRGLPRLVANPSQPFRLRPQGLEPCEQTNPIAHKKQIDVCPVHVRGHGKKRALQIRLGLPLSQPGHLAT
jgi:hypothetical protein